MIKEILKVLTKARVNQTIAITLGIYDIYNYSTSEKNSISSFRRCNRNISRLLNYNIKIEYAGKASTI